LLFLSLNRTKDLDVGVTWLPSSKFLLQDCN